MLIGWDFPAGPVVKNPRCNAGDTGSTPDQGTKIPHLGATKLVYHNYWAHASQRRPSWACIYIHTCIIPPHTHMLLFSHLSCVQLFATPGTAACQASLSFTISQSLLKLMSIESAMPSNHLILCHSLFLLPSIFFSIRIFSNELALCVRWPKY